MTSGMLFDRQLYVNIIQRKTAQETRIEGLRTTFTVEKTAASAANTCTISIYNLSESTRTALDPNDLRIQLFAGYSGYLKRIASGDLLSTFDSLQTVKQGADWITTFKVYDGGLDLTKKTASASFKKGTPWQTIVKTLFGTFTNSTQPTDFSLISGNTQTATTFDGQTSGLLDQIARSLGFEWTIQDDEIFINKPDVFTPSDTIPLITPESGLIETVRRVPTGITFKSLLNSEIIAGRQVRVDSRETKGEFRVYKLVHEGDTHGQSWFTTVEALNNGERSS